MNPKRTDRIEYIRTHTHLDSKQLSERLGISVAHVYKYCRENNIQIRRKQHSHANKIRVENPKHRRRLKYMRKPYWVKYLERLNKAA